MRIHENFWKPWNFIFVQFQANKSPLLSSLFASSNSKAIAALWDSMFQLNDPIISIFLITVLVINCGADEGLSYGFWRFQAIYAYFPVFFTLVGFRPKPKKWIEKWRRIFEAVDQ